MSMPIRQITDLIQKKKNGKELSQKEIEFFVQNITKKIRENTEECLDTSQIGAMLMAIYLKGFNDVETRFLTQSMKNSGRVFTWPNFKGIVVDKHSTGGVGDKISLVLTPALAAVGLKVPMISGRSLGHTGGTLNKLESIPGFKCEISAENIQNQINEIGCCIAGQTEDIVPADKELYRCRDLTSTVDHESLVTASIVSKKLAEGIDALVYDVKFGCGALFPSLEAAKCLAKKMISASQPTNASALLTYMNSPIGNEIGNSLEVLEAVKYLQGNGSPDLIELVEELGAELIYLSRGTERNKAKSEIRESINNKDALKKFHQMIIAQGVHPKNAHELCYGNASDVLPQSAHKIAIKYHGCEGYVQEIDSKQLACFCTENLSPDAKSGTGMTILKHVGEPICINDEWLIVHSEKKLPEEIESHLNRAIKVGPNNNGTRKRLYEIIRSADVMSENLNNKIKI